MSNDTTEWTLCIVKPDAVGNKHQAKILQRVIDEQFEIGALRMARLSRGEAEGSTRCTASVPSSASCATT